MDLKIKGGASLCVADSVDSFVARVILEQGDWVEREIAFLRNVCKPGWRAVDAGAGEGVYSFSLVLSGAAHVWALESTADTFERLRRGIQDNNFSDRVIPLQYTLSDANTFSHFEVAAGDVEFESKSLDEILCENLLPDDSIDFIRINMVLAAPGIIEGGKRLFNEQSPLVMFSVDVNSRNNFDLLSVLRDIGYGIYVLVPGLACLRPVALGEERFLDPLTWNLFACKDDRAYDLMSKGWLVQLPHETQTACRVSNDMLSHLLALPMLAEGCPEGWTEFNYNSNYGQAVLAWCGSRQSNRAPAMRWTLLKSAQQFVGAALEEGDYHPAVTMLATRVLSDLGDHSRAVQAANAFLEQMQLDDMMVDRPVPPVFDLFDSRKISKSLSGFLFESMLEFAIMSESYSGFTIQPNTTLIDKALANSEHSPEIERRAVMSAKCDGAKLCRYDLQWLFESNECSNLVHLREFAESCGFFRSKRAMAFAELMQQGQTYLAAKSWDEALACFRQASYENPSSAEAQFSVGLALKHLQRWFDAAQSFREALRREPTNWQAANNLGLVSVADQRYAEAEDAYRVALAQNLDCFDLHINFASFLEETGRWTEALYYVRQAVQMQPESALALNHLGSVLMSLSRTAEALPVLKKAVAISPGQAQIWNNLGGCYLNRGYNAEAETCYLESVKCDPEFMPAWTNHLRVGNYQTRDPAELFELHKQFGAKAREVFGASLRQQLKVTRERDKRLNIGFVSGDFRRHSVSYFVEGLLEHFNRKEFRLFSYFNHTPDARTTQFKKYFNHWRDIKRKSNQDIIDQIIDDKIDILFDLSGHTGGNRLAVFAAKPAPVQVTWIGYPNTSGLDTIDYRLTDGLVDPEGVADAYHTERLWRLPDTFLCYSPPASAPPVVSPPAAGQGFITFGSFNTRFKLGEETLSLWSRVLAANPNSRLVIKSAIGLSDPEDRETFLGRMVELGISPERVDLEDAPGSLEDHLALYNSIDIALDPFPYNGTTTTFEALWMGVPVVSLVGDRHASRVGASILTNAGLTELLAADTDEYVRIATELANDVDRLVQLRMGMRARLSASPLLDAQSMANNLSSALREMWWLFCDSPIESNEDGLATIDRKPPRLIKLHVGGTERRAGWKILNAVPGKHVDFDGDVRDLTRFATESCSEIYCSHVLEHLGQGEILPVLSEFHRLLCFGGKLRISVPDIDTLAWLFLSPQLGKPERFEIMRMIFGGQIDEYDFHYLGLNLDFMVDYLRDVGFSRIEHVEAHNLFDDNSNFKIGDIKISLNMVATK